MLDARLGRALLVPRVKPARENDGDGLLQRLLEVCGDLVRVGLLETTVDENHVRAFRENGSRVGYAFHRANGEPVGERMRIHEAHRRAVIENEENGVAQESLEGFRVARA